MGLYSCILAEIFFFRFWSNCQGGVGGPGLLKQINADILAQSNKNTVTDKQLLAIIRVSRDGILERHFYSRFLGINN
jgi:hypothetical protein